MQIILTPEESEYYFYKVLCNGLHCFDVRGLKTDYNIEHYEQAKVRLNDQSYEEVLMQILKDGKTFGFKDTLGDGEYSKQISLEDVLTKMNNLDSTILQEMIIGEDDVFTADEVIQTIFYDGVIFDIIDTTDNQASVNRRLNHPNNFPNIVKKYLLGMVNEYDRQNHTEHPEGTILEFRYDGETNENPDMYEDEWIEEFREIKAYLGKYGPFIFEVPIDDGNRKNKYRYSTDRVDIIMEWNVPPTDATLKYLSEIIYVQNDGDEKEFPEENEMEVKFEGFTKKFIFEDHDEEEIETNINLFKNAISFIDRNIMVDNYTINYKIKDSFYALTNDKKLDYSIDFIFTSNGETIFMYWTEELSTIKQYLVNMVKAYYFGNYTYPKGGETEFRFEDGRHENRFIFKQDQIEAFIIARDFLLRTGTVTIKDIQIDNSSSNLIYKFSTNGFDILVNWTEHNWLNLNKNKWSSLLN